MKRLIWDLFLILLFFEINLLAGCSSGGGGGATGSSLDSSFGFNGKVTGNVQGEARAVAIQTDGKIVAAGNSSTSSGSTDFTLARYNTDGSLDTNFGASGKVTTDFGTSYAWAYAVAIQANGKIVAAGSSSNSSGYRDFALARYNADGSLDSSFGNNGTVITDFGTSYDSAYAVAIQTDGKIVAAGESGFARYNIDGSLDTSFGSNGKVTTTFRTAHAVALQADGKIVAAGGGFNLARYNTDGNLDMSFGTNGNVTTAIGSFGGEAYAVVIQADGKIVAAGYSYTLANSQAAGYLYTIGPGYHYFALVRYNTDGSLDTGFGANGKVTTAIGANYDWAFAVAIQADKKIVAAGLSYPAVYSYTSDSDFALVRYNTNGSLDTSFGTNGKVTTAFGTSHEIAYAVAIQMDGKIVAAGVSFTEASPVFALARYLP